MNPKHRVEGAKDNAGTESTKENAPVGNGSSLRQRHDVDVLSRTTELALESAKAILDRYDELVSAAHRETALLLWRGITPGPLDNYIGSSLDVTKRAMVAAFSQGIALTEIAAKLQLESLALFRRIAVEGLAPSPSPRSSAGAKRGAL